MIWQVLSIVALVVFSLTTAAAIYSMSPDEEFTIHTSNEGAAVAPSNPAGVPGKRPEGEGRSDA